jgi:hypothetical protein
MIAKFLSPTPINQHCEAGGPFSADCLCRRTLLLTLISKENQMKFGIIGTVVLILVVAALLQNVYVGGLGGLLLVVLVIKTSCRAAGIVYLSSCRRSDRANWLPFQC